MYPRLPSSTPGEGARPDLASVAAAAGGRAAEALRVIEEEPGFLKRLGNRTQLQLRLRDDPLMRLDEFRLLSGPAETDVTEKYAA